MFQKDVAAAIGISTSCYGGYEQGTHEPDYKTLIKIAKFFEVRTDYLLGLEDQAGAFPVEKYVCMGYSNNIIARISRSANAFRVAFCYYFYMIGEKLRELRAEKELKQKEVAEIIGVSETCYAGYEQNYRDPDYPTLIKLAKFFEVRTDYLLGLED